MGLLIFGGVTLLVYWHLEFVLNLLVSIFVAFFIVSTLMMIAGLVTMLYPQSEKQVDNSPGKKIKQFAYRMKAKFAKARNAY
jgi:hypothetical protein